MDQENDQNPVIEPEEELPPIPVWVNAGYGGRSYECMIRSDSTMILPEGLVRELGMQVGDDLEWFFNEDEGVIYVKLIRKDWDTPEWLRGD